MELLHLLHKEFKWLVVILIVFATFNAFSKWRNGKVYGKMDKMTNLFTMILFHIQLLLGLILFFVRYIPRMSEIMGQEGRTYEKIIAMEHWLLMIIAVALVTIGRKKAEKSDSDKAKHRKIFTFYLISIVVVLVAIPRWF